MRTIVLILSGAALTAATSFSSPAAAEKALRSGEIVSGTGETPASFWVRGMNGCVGAPACSAWMQSLCNPRLAGRNPALHASIVDVRDLADGDAERVLTVRPRVGLNWGHVIVQFWTRTALSKYEYCDEIMGSRLNSWNCGRNVCTFRVPRGAKWMTITSSPDNTDIRWQLS